MASYLRFAIFELCRCFLYISFSARLIANHVLSKKEDFGEPRPLFESRDDVTLTGTSLHKNTSFESSSIEIGSAIRSIAWSRKAEKKEEKPTSTWNGASWLRSPWTNYNQIPQKGSGIDWDVPCRFWCFGFIGLGTVRGHVLSSAFDTYVAYLKRTTLPLRVSLQYQINLLALSSETWTQLMRVNWGCRTKATAGTHSL
jgi:hypothetical protein